MPMMCLLSISFIISAVSGKCLDNQQSLLLKLKNSLVFDTASSTKLVHWNKYVDCCSWKGVSCNEGRVIGLDLTKESISAGLDNSSSLFRLLYLQNLSLAYNNFDNSEIPSEFDKLSNLIYLNLSNVGFAGQIPIAISRLTRLVTLDLSTSYPFPPALKLENPNLNMLVQNLSELMELYLDLVNISAQGYEWCEALSSSLPNLRVLSMSGCYLSGPLNSSLLNLHSLSVIRLDNNNFSGPVPEFFVDFKNLTSLCFSSSGLNGKFPEKIFQIPTLQKLDLTDNELLQGSLPEFPLNGSLKTLLLRYTRFAGTLPSSIGNLKMLSLIDLAGCNFSGEIPNSMANLTQLRNLDMSLNSFNGSIPSFSMSKNLIQIVLSKNNLTGQIASTQWEELLNLVTLDLSYNSLEGSIPVSLFSLFSLPSLQKLVLRNNRFSGSLNEFSNVSSYLLETFDLSYNNLKGPIPMFIFELRGLKRLLLSSNNFSGSLQLNMIQQLGNLWEMSLSHNNLLIEYTGHGSSLSSFPQIITLSLASNKLKTFPDFLRNQSKLRDLDLSDNQIIGEIPNWIWKLPNLYTLNLSYNNLVTLDLPLLHISSLSVLDLHSNQLQGQLLVVPPYATYLDFSMNNFSFIIPVDIGNSLTSAYFFSFSSNKLHGSIPRSICSATNLIVLDLSNNFLSDTIPECLIAMSDTREAISGMEDLTLGVLNLRSNNLTGSISDVFPSNCGLQTLDLNENQIEGKLPKSLANCKKLEVLDIGNNYIKDTFPCYLKNIIMLRVLVLRSNEFYGPVGCPGPNATWPKLQIIDLASNNFTGRLPTKYFSKWRAMVADVNNAQSELIHHKFEALFVNVYYQDAVTIIGKGQPMELVKILTIFISLDFSCNNFEGPILEELGELKSLHILNLSHNAFTGQIPESLGKLTYLESLDLSSNELTGEIPVQLANGLIFLSVLNLSFNRLVGKIPQIKQFATFPKTSYEGNIGLCGFPMKKKCTHEEPRSSPSTYEDTHSNSGSAIDWNFLSAELGFVFGFGIVVGPLMFWKRWRICYYKLVDDIFFKMFPQLYIRIENYQRQARKKQGRRAYRNQGRRH